MTTPVKLEDWMAFLKSLGAELGEDSVRVNMSSVPRPHLIVVFDDAVNREMVRGFLQDVPNSGVCAPPNRRVLFIYGGSP